MFDVYDWDEYGKFLLDEVGLDRRTADRLSKMFNRLHHLEFTWIISRDENRSMDGKDLRDLYCDIDVEFDEPCSVLEMLIALAIRVDEEFLGNPNDPHPEYFFMEMISNLSLDKITNAHYSNATIYKIVSKWLNRTFHPSGNGSIFPLKFDITDQRKVEIWDQMNAYISEKYGMR